MTPRTRKDFEERDRRQAANMTAFRAWQKTRPGKCQGPAVRIDGGCLRCDADAGEACRNPEDRS